MARDRLWPTASVADVCVEIVDCINKTAPQVAEQTPYRMVRTTNIKNGRLDLRSVRCVTKEVFERWTRRAIPTTGDVLFTREAPLGEAAMVTDQRNIFLGQRTVLYRADPELLAPRFLLYSFLSSFVQDQVYAFDGSGSTVSHIRVPDCKKFRVTVPPLDEQRRIAGVLGALDDKIELNRKMNRTLEEMAQAIFKSWFIDFDGVPESEMVESELGRIPKGWQVRQLRDIAGEEKWAITAGPFGSKLTRKHYKSSGVPVIRGKNLGGAGAWFRDDDFVYVSEEHARALASSLARAGDVLFTQRGTLGQVGLIPDDPRFPAYVISQSQMKLTCAPCVPPIFVFLYFRQESVVEYIKANATAAGVPHINLGFLRAFKLVLPSIELLAEFNGVTRPLVRKHLVSVREAESLAALRDALLPKLISGEIRVPEAEKAVEAIL